MAPTYKLNYFNLRARGELARWIFAYANQEYEDNRIGFEQWPTLKANTPFGQLPYLEVDGKALAQSTTIARFLAHRFKLVGTNDWETAQADEIVDLIGDARTGYGAWISAFMAKNEALANSVKEEYTTKGVIPYLEGLQKKLKSNNNGTGYFVGNKVTWADLAVVSFLDELRKLSPTILDAYPALKAHSDRVHELKGIKEWVAKRPESPF